MSRGPERSYTTDDVLAAIRENRSDLAEPWTAPEIATILGCSSFTARTRLHELRDDGVLKSKSVGSSGLVWWIPIEAP